MAGIINYHGLSGLKQRKFIILQFCKLEVQQGLIGLKSRCWWGFAPSGSSRGEFVSILFLAFKGCLHSLAHVSFPLCSKTVL